MSGPKPRHLPAICPECGAKLHKYSFYGVHTNGQWNESATYDCDRTLQWSPNFSSMVSMSPCKSGMTTEASALMVTHRISFIQAKGTTPEEVGEALRMDLKRDLTHPHNHKIISIQSVEFVSIVRPMPEEI
jgi:hypothetical protein